MASTDPADTKCHLLTPPGTAAIAVVRVRGPQAWSVVRRHVRGRLGELLEAATPGRLRYGVFVDDAGVVDDVIMSYVSKPAGCDCVDLSCHGGVRVVERILAAFSRAGARVADSSDAPFPARELPEQIRFRALTLLERARTRRAALFLMAQADLLPREYERILQLARDGKVAEAQAALARLAERSTGSHRLIQIAEVALVGPPNAGKSRLANRLAGRHDGAIVTERAGTTRDWVTLDASFEGVPVTLIDTAGDRATDDHLEGAAIGAGRRRIEQADAVILVFDAADRQSEAARSEWWGRLSGRKWILALNKSDLCPKAPSLGDAGPGDAPVAVISAETGDGVDHLRHLIVEQLGIPSLPPGLPIIFEETLRVRTATLASDRVASAEELVEGVRRLMTAC